VGKILSRVGIASYGAYIPRWRLKIEEIARVWNVNPEDYKRGLMLEEKSVPSPDEDTATISVEAARNALKRAEGIKPQEIGALYVGSESHPYAVKPTAAIVAEAIGVTPSLMAVDMEFACKAATAGIQACMGMVKAGYIKYGMSIGADTAQSAPGDDLEFTASAGGAAYIIGANDLIAEIEDTYSFTQDVPDFWRREGSKYPKHGGRFTGEPGYFEHVVKCAKGLMSKMGTSPKDYDYAVFHEPNGKFPLRAAKILGFSEYKVKPSLMVCKIGNTYSGSSLLGLAAVLDIAKPGERIMATSYGSGAGSDSFSIKATEGIEKKRTLAPSVEYYVNQKEYIDYATYSRFKGQLGAE